MDPIKQINESILSGETDFFEIFQIVPETLDPKEAVNGNIPFKAKVSHADKKNLNCRIYPREVMAVAIAEANKLCKEGKFTGAIDHSYEGLQDCCLAWDSFWMESDGAIYGNGAIIKGANHSEHLIALMNSKVAIGFSTSGRGSAHRPTPAERTRFGLSEDDDCIIIDANYRMRKVDPVDGPSCDDAYMQNQGGASDKPKDAAQKPNLTETHKETDMKTLAELQSTNPDLFSLHQKAITDAVTAATAEATQKLEKAVSAFQSVLDSAKTVPGVTIPFKDVTAEQAAAKIAEADAKVVAKEAEITALKASLAAEQAKVTALEAEKATAAEAVADANRKAEIATEMQTQLKGHKYATQMNAFIAANKCVESKDFDKAALTKLIASKTFEWDAIAAGGEAKPNMFVPPTQEQQQSGSKSTAADVKKAFNL